jgi:hypothetical protein
MLTEPHALVDKQPILRGADALGARREPLVKKFACELCGLLPNATTSSRRTGLSVCLSPLTLGRLRGARSGRRSIDLRRVVRSSDGRTYMRVSGRTCCVRFEPHGWCLGGSPAGLSPATAASGTTAPRGSPDCQALRAVGTRRSAARAIGRRGYRWPSVTAVTGVVVGRSR